MAPLWVQTGDFGGAGECCGYLRVRPFLRSGVQPPNQPWKGGCEAPLPPPARPVLQMEVDGGEGLEAQDLPSDGEFEGEGDYEEGFFAEWWHEPKTKGDKADQGS